ncbi:Gfo/Idh/MocA family protein [Ferdinandcohnia quinoae]|uniref:Gfo/Idh/MocA family oxidoreductase n=1 Tax=Fredinandcohnia quinoae TaxID=2918902 RepID=A0AAW5DTM8_9BACI|nr:Gfo/Idh/MocA family oxidoreductase [Fredinandcohnia sp. SECRCQ15]MCH1624000.1 Gfo/Idh/MocA family oxidoreductase [Fredinandcohnia sp. SECRCQ15]
MIRFGVIGTNWITEEFIKGASETEDFTLRAVYSRTENRAKEFADKHGADFIYTDLDQFAKSEEIDAVYIASPNSFHTKQAIILMNHGKHVICEKPIASNTTELKQMIEAAKNNKVLLMEALKTTFTPAFISIKENLHKIGKIRRYFASYCQYSSRYDAYKNGTVLNAFNPVFSNGSLMDIGIYCIYPMIVLFGKPQYIKASGIMLDSGVDGKGSLIAHYEDMEGMVMYSKITNSYIPSEIQGENGSILIDKISSPEKVEIRYKDGSVEDISSTDSHHSMYYEAKEFIDLIKRGTFESSINSLEISLNVMEILDETREQIGLIFPADHH